MEEQETAQRGLEIIEVNSFTYNLSEWEDEGPENPARFDVDIKLNNKTPKEIFGNVANFFFSPWEFHASLKFKNENGENRFFIFTCGCGDAGCDGWFEGIRVETDKEKIIWFIKEKLRKPTKLIFRISDYRNFDLKLCDDIKKLAERKPSILFHPGYNSTITDLLPLILN